MLRIVPGPAHALYTTGATRTLEAAATTALPPHTLMQRAGLATARLALALAPHAQRWWIACGPGNNGGDGLEAALHLQAWGKTPRVSWLGSPEQAPADARAAYARARSAGVQFVTEPPADCEAAIDALLGIGCARAPDGRLAQWITRLNALDVPVLAVDLPSGLDADTGRAWEPSVRASHTLTLLTLKPGLYTEQGRDHSGEVWFDPLGVDAAAHPPQALLNGEPTLHERRHASHKGSYGDVAVIGGARGMGGAALLAARAALHLGAGRVYVGLLDGGGLMLDPGQPELMWRDPAALDPAQLSVVAGCGGGDAIRSVLPRLLSAAPRLVLDADALNAIARDTQLQSLLRARRGRGQATVLTPHPLEAARLLGGSTTDVQQDRLHAAQQLVQGYGACVVLKGSGTVIAAPQVLPVINPTGNARLATAGTGDVLAGLIGARLAAGAGAMEAACAAVWLHGLAADLWPPAQPLTAGALAQRA
ncbi:MAG: NAD(P)H-hydrate dehydratase [Hylemonella sp.]|uniref:NAD(P)H-hydrate dehydratase n=1 Tax=Hylemonella sp. TaxID=2066020 RepID=UPI00391BE3DF